MDQGNDDVERRAAGDRAIDPLAIAASPGLGNLTLEGRTHAELEHELDEAETPGEVVRAVLVLADGAEINGTLQKAKIAWSGVFKASQNVPRSSLPKTGGSGFGASVRAEVVVKSLEIPRRWIERGGMFRKTRGASDFMIAAQSSRPKVKSRTARRRRQIDTLKLGRGDARNNGSKPKAA